MLLLPRDLFCGDYEPSQKTPGMDRECHSSSRVASVRIDLGLGFLSTYLVAVVAPFPFVCGALFSRYPRAGEVFHRKSRIAFC